MRFDTAEYICGIQRLRNEVFTSDAKTLCVLGENKLNAITSFICDELKARISSEEDRKCYSVIRRGSYLTIVLQGPYHWEYNTDEDELLLVKGYDGIKIVNELGEQVAHDYDIDIMVALHELKEAKQQGKLPEVPFGC